MAVDVVALAKKIYSLPVPICYKEWVRAYSDITTHTRGKEPKKLFLRRPNEDIEINRYRKNNFRPITKQSINKGIDTLYRMFQSSSWTFTASQNLIKFLQENKFNGQTLKTYLESEVLRFDIEDANGLLCWFPKFDEFGILIGLEPKLFNSRKIRAQGENYYIVADGLNIKYKQDRPESDLYWIITDESIWKYYYKSSANSNDASQQWVLEEYYTFDFTLLPVIVLKGDQQNNEKDTDSFYESFFQSFVPLADEALNQFSDHQAVNILAGYPIREEMTVECDAVDCDHGLIYDMDGTDPTLARKCIKCSGTGRISPRTPYGVYIRKPKSNLDNDSTDDSPMVRFTSPDTAIVKYSSEEWQSFHEKAEDALHLIHTWDSQSGKAKEIDREGQKDMLTKVGNNFYDNIVFNTLWIIENYIGGSKVIIPVVHKPVSYEVRSEADVLKEIDLLTRGNAPKFIISATLSELIKKRFNDGDPIQKIADVILQFDAYVTYTQPERERLLALGLMSDEQFYNSLYAYPLLNKMADEMGNDFMTTDNDVLITKLQALIAPLIPKKEPLLTPAEIAAVDSGKAPAKTP